MKANEEVNKAREKYEIVKLAFIAIKNDTLTGVEWSDKTILQKDYFLATAQTLTNARETFENWKVKSYGVQGTTTP